MTTAYERVLIDLKEIDRRQKARARYDDAKQRLNTFKLTVKVWGAVVSFALVIAAVALLFAHLIAQGQKAAAISLAAGVVLVPTVAYYRYLMLEVRKTEVEARLLGALDDKSDGA